MLLKVLIDAMHTRWCEQFMSVYLSRLIPSSEQTDGESKGEETAVEMDEGWNPITMEPTVD
jgi:hypothetical protein